MIWAFIKAFFLYVFLRFVFAFVILFVVSAMYPNATTHPTESLIPLVMKLSHWSFWASLVLSVIYFFKAWD